MTDQLCFHLLHKAESLQQQPPSGQSADTTTAVPSPSPRSSSQEPQEGVRRGVPQGEVALSFTPAWWPALSKLHPPTVVSGEVRDLWPRCWPLIGAIYIESSLGHSNIRLATSLANHSITPASSVMATMA